MSTIVSNNLQIGQSGTSTNNFTLYQPLVADGTVRLANGNSGSTTDLLTVTSDGYVGIGTPNPSWYGGRLVVQRAQTSGIADFLTLRDSSAGTTFNFQTYSDPTFGTANRFNYNGTYIAFRKDTTEQLRITAAGAVVLQGGNNLTDGVGINFPAVQVASSNANTLDDYEEGTFTPSFTNITVGNGSLYGYYTKVGNKVTFALGLLIGTTTSFSGTVTSINGLPFTSKNIATVAYAGLCTGTAWDNGSGWTGLFGQISNNNTAVSYPLTAGTSSALTATVPFTWVANDSINISGTYFTS